MTKPRVLLVTYSFPPAGGVGVLRAASLARYLPQEEMHLEVLTTRNASAVGIDTALLADVPPEVKVYRTLTLDLPFGLKKKLKGMVTGSKQASAGGHASFQKTPGILKRMVQDILLPDPQVTWLPILIRKARKIVREQKIDIVLITVPPFSSLLLAEKLRKTCPHLRIVLDFRDEWLKTTIDLVSFSQSARAMRVARSTEANAVRSADVVVTVTEAARNAVRARYPNEPEDKFRVIQNGFEPARLQPSDASRSGSDLGGAITITFVGTLYGSTDPTSLVEALRSLPQDARARLHFRFVGHIENQAYRTVLAQLGDMVELTAFLPQSEALALLGSSDYALLITHDPINVAAKFYDYIGLNKPILAAIHPEGDVRKLLEQMRAGWWADSRDIQAMRQMFIDVARAGKARLAEFRPAVDKIAEYRRKPLAQRYAALLCEVADGGSISGLPKTDSVPSENVESLC